jgi:hypothetical protein
MSLYILSDTMYRNLIRFYFFLLIFSYYRLLFRAKGNTRVASSCLKTGKTLVSVD